ncbi:molybdenum cofactor guanylyltransferase MobA (plasmid) [Microvirga terrae]|uniref:Molybdenum cofactor guanylyltransferase n=1 Tax=Microvirga terrae TaxID=2740529 RepID=A0ABY5RYZ9_9HYPH|nr:molybdenum cofactor guanylyltransferase MobA [Microvirga terrae]UVF22184.1 molybdenum cofactor guanylyltransferase MobA [Microvirga terrae]
MKMSKSEDPLTLGVVLAGGLSRRMGGGDKPLRMLRDRTLLEHIIGHLKPQCAELILNANGDPARFMTAGLVVVPDNIPDFVGPLAGILAALDWTALYRPSIEWVVSVAADSPFLPGDFVAQLHSARRRCGTPLACAWSGGRTHPANGLWPVTLREDLRNALTHEKIRKIDHWTARYGVAHADWQCCPVDPFFNVNTPDDLVEAERLTNRGVDMTGYSNSA